MSDRPRTSGRAFRWRSRLAFVAVQTAVALLLATYLTSLVQFTAEQWREFWLAALLFAVFYGVLNEALQRPIEDPIIAALDEEDDGGGKDALVAAGFARAIDLPQRMFYLAGVVWVLAALVICGWMRWRLGELALHTIFVLSAAALSGGFLSCIVVYFTQKRLTASLRGRWARALGDPDRRAALVRRLPLRQKLLVSIGAVVTVTVFFAALMAHTHGLRPVEEQTTRIQLRYLERLAPRIDDGAGRLLELARSDLRELGVASDLLILDLETGAVENGPRDALSELERRWIAASSKRGGDSTGIDSDWSFAWQRLGDGPARALVAVTPLTELGGAIARPKLTFGLLLLAALGIAVLMAFLLASDVSQATDELRALAERIASGDLGAGSPVESEDELGDLGRAFERMSGRLRATVGSVAAAAEQVDAAAAEIAGASANVTSVTVDQIQGIEQAARSMAAINQQVSGITESAHDLNGNVEEASSSILELGAASEELNQTATALTGQVEDVSGSIEQLVRSVRQIAENTEGLADEMNATSGVISETASSMNEVDANAFEMGRLSSRVVELSETGRDRVRQSIEGMDAIREATDAVEAVIQGLGRRVGEIGAIVGVIDDVADETNLLALNAAIIAAQAGPQGRAFSVVADEIKDLADRVLSSTREIDGLIRAAQAESTNAVAAIDSSTERVQSGVDVTAEAGVSLEEITEAARTTGQRVEEIVGAVREQTKAASHGAGLMERVSQRLAQIRAAGREQERSNEVMMRGSMVMREVALQTRRTTEEQSRGANRIRESVESVRDAVDRIHRALQGQSEACRTAVSFLEQVHERTRSNGDSAARVTETARALREQAAELRDQVGRFRL